jgi:bisphosphoglycerate-dependent phosphoglycerate mutase
MPKKIILFSLIISLFACQNSLIASEKTKKNKNVNFSDEYIKEHKNKFSVEVPEIHELVNIMIAISKVGQSDLNMINHKTPYYKRVMKHFLPFKNHLMICLINKNITEGYGSGDYQSSYWYYYALKMSACGYLFDKKGKIVDDGIIHNMSQGWWYADPIKRNLSLIEDFAKETNFRAFYKKNKRYYNSLVTSYKALSPIDKMKKWLEEQFPIKGASYRVTFSPLVGGAHSTMKYEDNGFKQFVMYVNPPESLRSDNHNIQEMKLSRCVFTEIDHNFVNPISDRYKEQINKYLKKRDNWAKADTQANMYQTPYKVFNEYMTWAMFSLYCHDKFPEKDVSAFIAKMEHQMEQRRGFPKFKAFNRKLLALYKAMPETQKAYNLYPAMLTWCSEQ